MSDTLAQLIDKVQSTLFDDGTLFSDAACTAALRQSLADVNAAASQLAALTIAAAAGQLEYDLSAEDPLASGILDVLLQGDADALTPLPFGSYVDDGGWFFRLALPRNAGESLLVRYSLPHTVNGLDGATGTTLTGALSAAVLQGGAYYCCLLRSAATIESNNAEPDVSAKWLKVASLWRASFDVSLDAARRTPGPAAGPVAGWDDEWH